MHFPIDHQLRDIKDLAAPDISRPTAYSYRFPNAFRSISLLDFFNFSLWTFISASRNMSNFAGSLTRDSSEKSYNAASDGPKTRVRAQQGPSSVTGKLLLSLISHICFEYSILTVSTERISLAPSHTNVMTSGLTNICVSLVGRYIDTPSSPRLLARVKVSAATSDIPEDLPDLITHYDSDSDCPDDDEESVSRRGPPLSPWSIPVEHRPCR